MKAIWLECKGCSLYSQGTSCLFVFKDCLHDLSFCLHIESLWSFRKVQHLLKIPLQKQKRYKGESHYALWKFQMILEREDLWEFVKPEEDTSSCTLSVVLPNLRDIDTIDTIRKFKTKALLINKLSIKYQIVESLKKMLEHSGKMF